MWCKRSIANRLKRIVLSFAPNRILSLQPPRDRSAVLRHDLPWSFLAAVIHCRVINIPGKRCRIAIQDQRRTLETTLRKKSSARGARVLLITNDSNMEVFDYYIINRIVLLHRIYWNFTNIIITSNGYIDKINKYV